MDPLLPEKQTFSLVVHKERQMSVGCNNLEKQFMAFNIPSIHGVKGFFQIKYTGVSKRTSCHFVHVAEGVDTVNKYYTFNGYLLVTSFNKVLMSLIGCY